MTPTMTIPGGARQVGQPGVQPLHERRDRTPEEQDQQTRGDDRADERDDHDRHQSPQPARCGQAPEPPGHETGEQAADDAADEAGVHEDRDGARHEPGGDTGTIGDRERDIAGQSRDKESHRRDADDERDGAEVLSEAARGQIPERILDDDRAGFVAHFVPAEGEADRDQQTATGDERDHVAHTGEQDPLDPRTPRELRGRRGGGGGGRAADARRARVVRCRDGLTDHLVGLLDAALDTGADHRLAGEASGLPNVDVGREDHRIRVVDRAVRQRLVAARALRLDDEVDAGLLARGGERVGCHERVGDAGRTRGDRHDAGRSSLDAEPLGDGGRRGSGGCGGRRRGRSGITLADRIAHDRDDLVGARGGAEAGGEVVLHEAPGELRQHREVGLGSALGSGDEEDQVGGAVGCAEVDTGLQPGERERRRDDRGALRVRNRDAAGQAGLVLLLTRPRVGEQRLRIGGAALLGDTGRESTDHRRLVGAERGVERHQLWRDGLGHDDLQWSVVRSCGGGGWIRCSVGGR